MISRCGECRYFKASKQILINKGMSTIVCTFASNNVGAFNTWETRSINKLGTRGNEICTNYIKG